METIFKNMLCSSYSSMPTYIVALIPHYTFAKKRLLSHFYIKFREIIWVLKYHTITGKWRMDIHPRDLTRYSHSYSSIFSALRWNILHVLKSEMLRSLPCFLWPFKAVTAPFLKFQWCMLPPASYSLKKSLGQFGGYELRLPPAGTQNNFLSRFALYESCHHREHTVTYLNCWL